MTPAARVAAAITVLDDILAGRSAEQALSHWARNSRFAGSKDRAALRDLVFDALRKRASSAALGGGLTGRGLMIGSLKQEGIAPADMFTGEGHAPPVLSADEMAVLDNPPTLSPADAHDLPAWLWPVWQADLQDEAAAGAQTLRARAPMFLRVNQRRGSVAQAIAALSEDNIAVAPHPTQTGCLRVESNPRRVKLCAAYTTGLVEIQDAASQIAVAQINVPAGARVLDYCAGGGGKALALADMCDAQVTAHDVAAQRMGDIGPRATRAGVTIDIAETGELGRQGPFDSVVVDAPCSGSGTWRRNPEAKWAFTPEKLNDFSALQGDVLRNAAAHLTPGGTLYYMTCSVLEAENMQVVEAFVGAQSGWSIETTLRLLPHADHDGFFMCKLLKQEEIIVS